LDVTEDKLQIGSAIEIATRIRQSIKDELNLTASAGVSINKFVAKIASDMKKPDGLTFIGPSRIESFMEKLPVDKFFGVGKVTAEKMKNMGLHTGADLKKLSENELVKNFGKTGKFFFRIVRGIDDREVRPDRETKSVGAEDTFPADLVRFEEMYPELEKLATIVFDRLERHSLKGRTVTLKIKYHDFKIITRSHSLTSPVESWEQINQIACNLLQGTEPDKKVRLLGISISNFEGMMRVRKEDDDTDQLRLF
jgi:DNA polymerase IV